MTVDPALGTDTILLAGAGKMGSAMLRGWLALGVARSRMTVVDPSPSADLQSLCRDEGVRLNPASASRVDTLVLAIKPQMLEAAASTLVAWSGPDTLLLSVLAGKTVKDLAARFPDTAAIVRAMPNLPASVGRGVTGVASGHPLSPSLKARVEQWLGAVGRVEWLDREDDIDIVTAVSGSGPAYVFLLAEALGQAAHKAGLPADLAERLARATVEGAGELMYRSPEVPTDILRQNVTSPGGTTAAALEVLMAETGLQPLLNDAVAAAFRRARELAS